MPRAVDGTYTLPPGYAATANETATASQHNTPLEDIAATLNEALPVAKGGTGSTNATAARAALGLGALAALDAPADDSLTTAMYQDDSVTAAKIADDAVEVAALSQAVLDLIADAVPTVTVTQTTTPVLYAASTDTELAALAIDVTTTSDGQRVLLEGTITAEPGAETAALYIKRDGTEIGSSPSAGVRVTGIVPFAFSSNAGSTSEAVSFIYEDTVPTAGTASYTFHVRQDIANSIGLNRTISDTNAAAFERATSTIKITVFPAS